MRKIKIYSIVSIEGFGSRPDGSMDWIAEANIPREVDFGIHAFYDKIGTVVMTLTHYLSLFSCDLLGPHIKKSCIIVRNRSDFSVSEISNIDYITDSNSDFSETVSHLKVLKNTEGDDIWVAGDGKLIIAMLEAGIVDEIIITMIPVSLGKGNRILPADFNEEKWKPVRVDRNENGITQIHYHSMESGKEDIIN